MRTHVPAERNAARAGFTLVELMAASVASAVLLLTVGCLLWFGYLGWKRTSEAVNLQRDMRASMDVLTRMVRSGTNMTFSTSLVFVVQYSNRPPSSVTGVGSNLFYDPNTTASGDGAQLVYGTLRQFHVAIATNLAYVTLRLSNSVDTISNRVAVFRRN
jgi:prepilin-type N-terminal cleavage/methylation domain-containing protein